MGNTSTLTLESIENEIISCKGYQINGMMEALDLSLQIFKRNFAEAKSAYDFLKRPEIYLTIFQPQNKSALTLYILEVFRTFFNFEASAASLVDHSRCFKDKYETQNETFCRKYQCKVDEDFTNNPLAKFVKDIRNYVIHKGYPGLSLNVPLLHDRPHEYLLNTESLLEWDGWTTKSKQYIHDQGEIIELFAVLESYYKMVSDFYTWMFAELKTIHEDDYREVNLLIKKRNAFLDSNSGAQKEVR